MKIKEGYVLREVAGQFVVVAVGKEAINFNGMITLNSTAKYLWELLRDDKEMHELVTSLCEKYEVTEDKANIDVASFIQKLKQASIIQ